MNASNVVIGHPDRTSELFYDWSSGAELEQFDYSALIGWAAFEVGGSVVMARDQSATLNNKP